MTGTNAETDAGTPPLVLADPVRQRLLRLAADVVGRMPADELPAPLRPVAKFTPAKRVRLGAAVLSAALDADDGFRERVADAVATANPQLVGAVRAGEATPASDPLDSAVVAYLIRPPRWAELVSEVGRRWADEQSARDAATDEIARLNAEVAELRAQLRAEAGAHRDALSTAAAGAAASAAEEATRLRNLLRTRTGELRAADRAREAAVAEADRLRAELETAAAGSERDLAGLRARIADLERSGGSVRRDTRAGREADETRLRLLLDTLTDAAAGVRRELALPASALRPADLVTGGDGEPGAGARVEIDRLLALPQVHLIADGYNVTKTGYPELPLADQRARLIAALAALHARTGIEVTIAFDGGVRPPAQPRTPRGVRVLFSAPGEIADDLIRRLVAAEPSGRPLVVVTSDQEVVTDVTRAGAWTVPSAALLDRLG